MIEKLFVPLHIAKEIIRRGFDEECLNFYSIDNDITSVVTANQIPAPLYQQVFDWMREYHDIHIYIKKVRSNDRYIYFIDHSLGTEHGEPTDEFYKACTKGIEKAFQVIDSI